MLSTKLSVQPHREPKLMNPESWPFAKKCMYGDVLLYWLDHLSDSTCIDRHEIDNLSCGRFLFSFSTHRQSLKSYTIKLVSAWVLNIKFGSMEPFTNHKYIACCHNTNVLQHKEKPIWKIWLVAVTNYIHYHNFFHLIGDRIIQN